MSIITNSIHQEPSTPVLDAGSLAALYLEDEVAWLDIMARMIRERDIAGLDLENLAECLTDMSNRERREVKSRLVVLLAHLLKWNHQLEKRTRSWRMTALVQRQELADIAGQGVLRIHADAVLAEAYTNAIQRAVLETRLPASEFPDRCPYTVDQLLSMNLIEGEIA